MSENSTALATIDAKSYALIKQGDVAETMAILKENLEGDELTARDLDRVKVPSGGGLAWEIPDVSGEPKVQQTFEGVIVCHRRARLYWAKSFDESGGGTPPDCTSDDARTGVVQGTEAPAGVGGDCARCPMSKFGSDPGGTGQACKEIKQLFVVLPGTMLPVVLSVPPTSLRNGKNYLQRLSSIAKPYYGVVTKFALARDKNDAGIEYSKVTLSASAFLDEGARGQFKAMSDALKPHLLATPVSADDYAQGGTPGGGAPADTDIVDDDFPV